MTAKPLHPLTRVFIALFPLLLAFLIMGGAALVDAISGAEVHHWPEADQRTGPCADHENNYTDGTCLTETRFFGMMAMWATPFTTGYALLADRRPQQ